MTTIVIKLYLLLINETFYIDLESAEMKHVDKKTNIEASSERRNSFSFSIQVKYGNDRYAIVPLRFIELQDS